MQRRIEYLAEQIARHKISSFVDLGCGADPVLTKSIIDLVEEVTCVDIIDSFGFSHHKVKYIKLQDPMLLPFETGTVDVIWASHVLEHICNLGNYLIEIRRVLKQGGLFFVAVPPFKYEIVNHFTTGWSVGQLAYVLAGFGFDCSEVEFRQSGYNVLGGGFRRELLNKATDHFGVNGISIKQVFSYLPHAIKQEIARYQGSDESVYRFDGRININ